MPECNVVGKYLNEDSCCGFWRAPKSVYVVGKMTDGPNDWWGVLEQRLDFNELELG